MLSQFQASYSRLEQSLQRLTDSIAAYQPSIAAAEELLAVDDEVNGELEQQHQTNHRRIQELKATTESLDATIKDHVRTLADLHKEIESIPSFVPTTDVKRNVKIDDLLAYAKFISKTTVPPTFRKPLPESLKSKSANGEAAPVHITNGIATPPSGAHENGDGEQKIENLAVKQLSEDNRMFLDSAKHLPFEPWPSTDVIQQGGLAAIQRLVEEGQDPAEVMTANEREEVERQKAEEERQAEEALARVRMASVGGIGRRAPQNDVFDPDEA